MLISPRRLIAVVASASILAAPTLPVSAATSATVPSVGTVADVEAVTYSTIGSLKCAPTIWVAARGSGEGNDNELMGRRNAELIAAHQAYLAAGSPPTGLSVFAVRYPANAIPIPARSELIASKNLPAWVLGFAAEIRDYVAGAQVGLDLVRTSMRKIHDKCPSSRLVLTGYSQGAWVMSAYARSLSDAESTRLGIAKVVLISDPAAHGGEPVLRMNSSGVTSDGVTSVSNGIATLLDRLPRKPSWYRTYSILMAPAFATSTLAGKVISVCAPLDLICDAGRAIDNALVIKTQAAKDGATIHTGAYSGNPASAKRNPIIAQLVGHPAAQGTVTLSWVQESALPNGPIIERVAGTLKLPSGALKDRQTVDIEATLTVTYPNTPDVSPNQACRSGDQVAPPVRALSLIPNGSSTLGNYASWPNLGSLAFPSPAPWTSCFDTGRQVTTIRYSGPATLFVPPGSAPQTASICGVWAIVASQNGLEASTLCRAYGPPITIGS